MSGSNITSTYKWPLSTLFKITLTFRPPKNFQNTLHTLFTLKFCSMTCKLSSVNVESFPNPLDPREQCSNGGIGAIQLTNMS